MPSTNLSTESSPQLSLKQDTSSEASSGRASSTKKKRKSAPVNRPPLNRHWSSFQEHAAEWIKWEGRNSPSGSTPRPESRREGFIWDRVDESRISGVGIQAAPKAARADTFGIIYDEQDDLERSELQHPWATMGAMPFPYEVSVPRKYSNSSSQANSSRRSSIRSSVGSITRGLRRGIPDLRIFSSENTQDEQNEKQIGESSLTQSPPTSAVRRLSHATRHMSIKNIPSLKRDDSDSDQTALKKPKTVHISEDPSSTVACPSSPLKKGIKDRRLKDAHALELSLPLNFPSLPPRHQRQAANDSHFLVPPRPRSPETPAFDIKPTWLTTNVIPPPTISEKPTPLPSPNSLHGQLKGSEHISTMQDHPRKSEKQLRGSSRPSRPWLFKRKSHTKSESSGGSSQPKGSPALEEIHTDTPDSGRKKRLHRWRSNSPVQSPVYENIAERRASASRTWTPFKTSKSKLTRSREPSDTTPTGSTPTTNDSAWIRKLSLSSIASENSSQVRNAQPQRSPRPKIPRFHRFSVAQPTTKDVSPLLDPPKVQPIPEPPTMMNTNGDVNSKLAGFFFDHQAGRSAKCSSGNQRGIWDSDALLMSQEALSENGNSSEESPQASGSAAQSPSTANPKPVNLPGFPPLQHSAPETPQNWFRRPFGIEGERNTPGIETGEDYLKATLEWQIPEHLPGSPLCPLSPKYRGPYKDWCVYHGRKDDVDENVHEPSTIPHPETFSVMDDLMGLPKEDAKSLGMMVRSGM